MSRVIVEFSEYSEEEFNNLDNLDSVYVLLDDEGVPQLPLEGDVIHPVSKARLISSWQERNPAEAIQLAQEGVLPPFRFEEGIYFKSHWKVRVEDLFQEAD